MVRKKAKRKPSQREESASASASRTQETRLALLRAAEHLFAEHGVDAISLREVALAAGQRNSSAVQYHFKTKDVLLDAALERHTDRIQAQSMELLDQLEARGTEFGIREVVEVLVRPIVAKLDDEDGGWDYVRLSAQLNMNTVHPMMARRVATNRSSLRLGTAMMQRMYGASVPAELLPLRMHRIVSLIYLSVVEYGRLVRNGTPIITRELFTADLIDGVVGVITPTQSAQTTELLLAMRGSRR